MNNLNYTSLFGFLAMVFLVFSLIVVSKGHSESSQKAFNFCTWGFILFGSLTALTWGG